MGHDRCRQGGKDTLARIRSIQKHPPRALHAVVGFSRIHPSLSREGKVGARKRKKAHPVCQFSERKRGGGKIRAHVPRRILFPAAKPRDPKTLGKTCIDVLRAQPFVKIHRNGILGENERILGKDQPIVPVGGIARPRTRSREALGHVVKHGRLGDQPLLNGGGIEGYRLECRAGGTARIRGIVEKSPSVLLTKVAHKRDELSRLGRKEGAPCMKPRLPRKAGKCRLRRSLRAHIARAVNMKPAAVKKGDSRPLAVARRDKISLHLKKQMLVKPRKRLRAYLFLRHRHKRLRQGCRTRLFLDQAKLRHAQKHAVAPRFVRLLVFAGRKAGGRGRDGGKACRLGKGQFPRLLAEIVAGCRAHADTPFSERHDIQIGKQDLLLGVLSLK